MKKPIFIFLLGRPGCGKSEFYRRLSQKLQDENIAKKIERIDDYPKLEEKWKQAKALKNFSRIKPSENGTNLDSSFTIVDLSLYDEILKDLNQEILNNINNYDVLFIEFSRSKNLDALKNFTNEILKNAIAVYLDVPFEICWERIVSRIKKLKEEGIDSHLVPKEKMESMYKEDDKEIFLKNSPIPVVHIQNKEREGFKKMEEGVYQALKLIKERFQ